MRQREETEGDMSERKTESGLSDRDGDTDRETEKDCFFSLSSVVICSWIPSCVCVCVDLQLD